MRKVIVLSGVSGSGKSTYVSKIRKEFEAEHGEATSFVVSADNFFVNEDGEYEFDASNISEAHNQCFREFIDLLSINSQYSTDAHIVDELIVVDNTNLSVVEISPYMLAGSAFAYETEIHTFRLPISETWDIGAMYVGDIRDSRYGFKEPGYISGATINKLVGRNVHGLNIQQIELQIIAMENRKLQPWWKEVNVEVSI